MPFTTTEKQSLLALKGIAPAAFRCLQEMGVDERIVKSPLAFLQKKRMKKTFRFRKETIL